LDLAPADRAALKLGGQFNITAQMEKESNDKEIDEMPTKEEILAELTVDDIPKALRDQIVKETTEIADTETQIAELKQQIADKDQIIGTLQDDLKARQAQEFEATLDAQVAELVDWQVEGDEAKGKVAAFQRTVRTRILSELGEERDTDKLAEAVKVAWEDMQPLAEMIRDALAGPPARVSGKVRDRHKIEDTPEARARARAKMGL
jgi:septal ring factor EnvC (AmiA/AmiB activator)